MNFQDYMTVTEASEFLGVSVSTLRRWDRLGELKPKRHPINKYRLYKKEELEKLLKSVEESS